MTDADAPADREKSLRKRWRRRQVLRAAAAAGVTGLAGCNSGGSRESGTSTSPPTRPPTRTATDAPTDTPTVSEAKQPTDTADEPSTEEEDEEDDWTVDPVDHDRLVGAYYYQWYHGDDGYGLHDKRPWLEHVPGKPVLGEYHSRDPDVINQHIKWALEHGINWFMCHGAAPGTYDEVTLRNYVMDAELADRMQFSLITGIPNKFRSGGQFDMDDPDLRRTVADQLATFEELHFGQDNYLTIDGAPAIMYYAVGTLTGDVAGAWEEIRCALEGDVCLVADPNMGVAPGFTSIETPAWELAEAFDAFTEYNMNPLLQLRYGAFDRTDLQRHYRNWWVAAEDYDIDFIPMTIPGEDHSEIKWKEPRDFTLARQPERFRQLCRDALRYRDADLDAVLVTSFNEWPEFTGVEPTESAGTTYLEIAEAELARGQQAPLQVDGYVPLDLDFNRAVDEQEINPKAGTNRRLTFQLSTITFQAADGSTVAKYDIGVREAEPVFTRGVHSPFQPPDPSLDTARWLGGQAARSRLYLDAGTDTVDRVTMLGRPVADDISAQVRYDGAAVGEIAFDDGVSEYSVSLE